MSSINWRTQLTKRGALWKHDGHPKRPYALLTAGEISNEYADMTFAVADPFMIRHAADDLCRKLAKEIGNISNPGSSMVFCGLQKGSVTLASRIAENLGAGFLFANQVGVGSNKQMEVDERFVGIHNNDALAVVVEDTTTTGHSAYLGQAALRAFGFKNVSPLVLTLVQHAGKKVVGLQFLSCYDHPSLQKWERGKNPFTRDGQELVEPVRPKTKLGRIAMRQIYT